MLLTASLDDETRELNAVADEKLANSLELDRLEASIDDELLLPWDEEKPVSCRELALLSPAMDDSTLAELEDSRISVADELTNTLELALSLVALDSCSEEKNAEEDAACSAATDKLDTAALLISAELASETALDWLLKDESAAAIDELPVRTVFELAPPPQAVSSNTKTAGATRDKKHIEKPFIT